MKMNSEAMNRGGAVRSSVEASVMGVEQRGCVTWSRPYVNSVGRMSVWA